MAPAKQDTASEMDAALQITENFAELLNESLGPKARFEGRVVKGSVIDLDNDTAWKRRCVRLT